MKTIITAILPMIFLFIACNDNDDEIIAPQKQEISFTGIWGRQFEPMPGNLHTADYKIYQDSIRYTLTGALGQADYVMLKDTFLLENNRFIGHTDTKHYLLFATHVNNDSITLYKQEVNSVEHGLSIDLPAEDDTNNHGWNTYYKK